MKKRLIPFLLATVFILICSTLYFSARWYSNTFDNQGFFAILYTLTAGVEGTGTGLISGYLAYAPVRIVLCTILGGVILWMPGKLRLQWASKRTEKRITVFPFPWAISLLLTVALCVGMLGSAAMQTGVFSWVQTSLQETHIYEDEYVDPAETEISFPEQKRNLIYIFLESMETTFLSKLQGGAEEQNRIPELYQLARENVNFSHNWGVGGWAGVTNTGWTIAAMVAQNAGIPLSVLGDGNAYGADGNFLPGATTLTDVLQENGYYQTLMVGSDSTFGGRKAFYEQHGVDRIYDLYTAFVEEKLPWSYYEWWGFEDVKLYEYAKEELLEISAGEEAFAFYILTADTHHVGGYLCQNCVRTDQPEQYRDVYSCASRQIYEFIQWCKEQLFYENTAIVICGDHLSMDGDYFTSNVPEDYERHVYNCFINADTTAKRTKNRMITPMDMFPTTLAAMGCEIEGNRLALGINLFSGEKTLAEQFGMDTFNELLGAVSEYEARFCGK